MDEETRGLKVPMAQGYPHKCCGYRKRGSGTHVSWNKYLEPL